MNTNQEPLKKAIKYTLNHREYFTNFLLDGRIPISNCLSENASRPVALARKNEQIKYDELSDAQFKRLIRTQYKYVKNVASKGFFKNLEFALIF